jgi:DNA-binding transcriptional MerR regulator
MSATQEHPHRSIGEVLSSLSDEFPDVTISKIRFLESQGLIAPERTPSGYRKFYDTDVERLRWILTQQKDNFLPLKVIKDRLDDHDRTGAPLDPPTEVVVANEPPSDDPTPPVEGAASVRRPSRSRSDSRVNNWRSTAAPTICSATRPVRASRGSNSPRRRASPSSRSANWSRTDSSRRPAGWGRRACSTRTPSPSRRSWRS